MGHDLILELDPISQEQLADYSKASGDYNPIHLDGEVAKELGQQGVIAHGMLTMGLMVKLFSTSISKGAFIQELTARFKAKVYVGDRLTINAMFIDQKGDQVEYHLQVRNQSGILAAEGKAILTQF